MRFDFTNMNKVTTTANYFGLIDFSNTNLRIKKKDVILSLKKDKGEFKFYGEPVSIGIRQLESEEWTATPLYIFDFLDDDKKSKMSKNYQFPYLIKITKKLEEGEFISKSNIEVYDNQGIPIDSHSFDFRLRTSRTLQLHWKDNGSFITRIE